MNYGYPFDAIPKQRQTVEDSPRLEPVTDDSYRWQQVAGTSRSPSTGRYPRGPLADEIRALCALVEELLFV